MPNSTVVVASGKGNFILSIPVALVTLQTSALSLLTDWLPGFEGNIVAIDFVTNAVGTGAAATQSISVTVNDVATTGGVLTLALADTTPAGKIKLGTAVTQNSLAHFIATSRINVLVAASGTAFTAGSGALLLTVQNVQDF